MLYVVNINTYKIHIPLCAESMFKQVLLHMKLHAYIKPLLDYTIPYYTILYYIMIYYTGICYTIRVLQTAITIVTMYISINNIYSISNIYSKRISK